MKISRRIVAPVMAALLAVGFVAASASMAQAAAPKMPGHAPLFCMLAGRDNGSPILDRNCGWGVVGGSGQIGNAWGYDRGAFVDTKDFSPWAVINDPRLFPSSDSGYTCIPGDYGSALCSRSSDSAPKPGIDNATIAQLQTESNRGSVLGFEEKDNVACTSDTGGAGSGCFRVTVTYPRYHADAVYDYDGPGGTPYIRSVGWYKNDGKGYGGQGTYIGNSKSFLTAGAGPDAMEPAASATAGSGISATTATSAGGDVTFQLNILAQKAGSAIVHMKATGFTATNNRSLPNGWSALPTSDNTEVAYMVPDMTAGESATAWVHFTATGASSDIIFADVNGAQTSQTLTVRPSAPTCTDADNSYNGQAVIPVGGAVAALDGVFCTGQSDSTLKVWTGNQHGAGTLALVGSSATSHSVTYQAPDAAFTGCDTVYVYDENSAGVASLPTPIKVVVAGPASASADSFSTAPGSTLTVDALHGLTANDTFPAGSVGWTVQQGYAPANGTLATQQDGSFTYTPHNGFTGDDTFRYRLNGPHGQNSNVVTVTIHVGS